MKYFVAVLLALGLAFASAAPIDDVASIRPMPGDAEERALPLNPNERSESVGQEEVHPIKDLAARAFNTIAERGLLPSVKDIAVGLQDKYLTPEGRALFRSLMNISH